MFWKVSLVFGIGAALALLIGRKIKHYRRNSAEVSQLECDHWGHLQSLKKRSTTLQAMLQENQYLLSPEKYLIVLSLITRAQWYISAGERIITSCWESAQSLSPDDFCRTMNDSRVTLFYYAQEAKEATDLAEKKNNHFSSQMIESKSQLQTAIVTAQRIQELLRGAKEKYGEQKLYVACKKHKTYLRLIGISEAAANTGNHHKALRSLNKAQVLANWLLSLESKLEHAKEEFQQELIVTKQMMRTLLTLRETSNISAVISKVDKLSGIESLARQMSEDTDWLRLTERLLRLQTSLRAGINACFGLEASEAIKLFSEKQVLILQGTKEFVETYLQPDFEPEEEMIEPWKRARALFAEAQAQEATNVPFATTLYLKAFTVTCVSE